MSTKLQEAAKLMADRLRVLKRTAQQAKEREDTHVSLHVEEIWEAKDEAALEAYEAAYAEAIGAQPLFKEGVA